MKITPPKWADQFLRWYCDPDVFEDIQGDLYELHQSRVVRRGKRYANLAFVRDVFMLLRLPLLKNPLTQRKISIIINNDFNSGTSVKVLTLKPLNELVFERRNKDYGAYRIRSSYDRNMLFGFSFVVLVAVTIVLWWWIALIP